MDSDFWRAQPLLFGHVREDADTERWLASVHGRVERAVVIASGGCTALSLASLVGTRLDAVDVNARQVALTDLKRAALSGLAHEDFLQLLTGPTSPRELCRDLPLAANARRLLNELPKTLPNGLQNSGRVDRMMGILRQLLSHTVHSRRFLENFLLLSDPALQRSKFDQEWDTRRWRLATKIAFNRLTLAAAFGSKATRKMTHTFASDIQQKVRAGLTSHPCLENGHAWQDFLGSYPPSIAHALPWYAQKVNHAMAAASSARISTHTVDAASWLGEQDARSIDFFALSNILELCPPAGHAELLAQVSRTAAPNAILCLRSILPFGQSAKAIGALIPSPGLTSECERRERALICNRFQVFTAAAI